MLLVSQILENAARVAPDAIAATLDDQSVTFAEIDRQANGIANALAGEGIGCGDRVLWWGDTDLDAVPVFCALAKLGAVFAPLNARSSLEEVTPVAEYARPHLLLAGSSHVERAAELAPRLSVPFRHGDLTGNASTLKPRAGAIDERDPHVIFFTSGSTGRPKGVVLSHRANWLRTFVGATSSPGGGGTVCMFPLFHMAGWTIALGAWQARRPVHFVRDPDAPTLLAATARHHAARLYCIPAVWGRILEHGVSDYDLTSLIEADTGTSATPPELLAAIKDALPNTVTRVFYGSTEAGPSLALGDADLFRKPGSVGVSQPAVEVRLDQHGEVCVHSPFLMDGYFDDPDATRETLVDGWYHTGDLGAVDDEGYMAIVGRARDVIRTGGETVAPREVEALLGTHPNIAEVAVVGVPDAQWGEVVTAVIVTRSDSAPMTVEELRAFCEGRLAGFKHPRRVAIVDSLPHTAATGQIQRPLIVERLQQKPESA
ncbi:MAG: class I adenylate-forming enzyme family protein [Acidimicrobiia bacterium]